MAVVPVPLRSAAVGLGYLLRCRYPPGGRRSGRPRLSVGCDALLGEDEFCMNYLTDRRAGQFS